MFPISTEFPRVPTHSYAFPTRSYVFLRVPTRSLRVPTRSYAFLRVPDNRV
jgi:hypothetical protein